MFFTLNSCFVLLITILGNLVPPLATFFVALLLVLQINR